MKKILILITILFLCTGCYDYKEVSDLAIISAIGIEYENDLYEVTFEVLKDNTKDNESSFVSSATGKTLTEAIDNVSDKLPKQSTYSHVKLMVLGKNILQDFSSIKDLFLRNTYFRENFYVIGTETNTPEEILSLTGEDVASDTIIRILKNMNYSSNENVLKTFHEVINESTRLGNSTCFSNITINEEEFIIDGLLLFKDYQYKGLLSNEDAKLYNILTSNFDRPTYSLEYNNLTFTVGLSDGSIKMDTSTNLVSITGSLKGKIIDNEPNFNIRDTSILSNINTDFTNLLNLNIQSFMKRIQDLDTDILGLNEQYYKKTRSKNKDYFRYIKIDSNISFTINKKGLIYENK